MRYITVTELRRKLGYYMSMSQFEDICVTKNGKVVTMLTSPRGKSKRDIRSLKGFITLENPNIDYDEILGEAIMEHEMSRG